ncbi:unnamed protein product [Echinostoma caproni]|uniref:Splicing factor 45 n=1 Tax=Echinostoma caproni TaxID=27848 RepID=A0A183AFR7_9TREM|nr:unnamed protein product [Echinostoma caproni]
MQSHMAAKRAQGRRHGSELAGGQWSSRPSIAPVVDLKQRHPANADGSYRFNQQTGRLERVGRTSGVLLSNSALPNGGILFGEPNLSLGVVDEYNPLVPNDYDELARQKRERRRAEEAAIAASSNRNDHGDPSGMCRRPDFSDEEDEDEDDGAEPTAASGARRRRPPPPPSKGAAIAPPSVLLEDTTIEPGSTETEEPEPSSATSLFGINAVAAKMMARMGYREGQGLGRESQGMSTALVVEKTSRRGGKIIHERDHQRQQANIAAPIPIPPADAAAEETITNLPLPENRSCVILLRNMCGPGEVDDDLEPETAEECAKYGKVVSCMIFELPESPDDEAVRIFVEFDSDDAATKAVLDLNGRFFAGRVVKAGFYDAEKFRNLELNEPPISA